MNRRFALLLLAAWAAFLSVACTNGNIYWTLENEEKVDDLSLPNEITVFDVAKIGSTYYAAAGRIWHVADTAGEWNAGATVAPPHAGDLCTALVAFGPELYGGFVNSSGSLGLFATSSLAFSAAPVADAAVLGAQVALLKIENGEIAVVTARQSGPDFAYTVVTGDGSSFAELPFLGLRVLADTLVPIDDVIYSSSLGAWFVTEGTTLRTDSGTVTMNGITSGETLTGLFDDGFTVYLASEAGAVYWWDAAAIPTPKWQRVAAPTVSGDHPPLTRFAGPVGTDDILLVGSEGYGYYRLPTNPAVGVLTRFPTTTSPLYTSSVWKFFLDDPMNRIFACTLMGGLWRGAVDTDGTIDWNLE